MRHIYVGMSTKKVWCGAKLSRTFPQGMSLYNTQAPITEGEYIDGRGGDDTCDGCIEAIEPVRGRPVVERGAE